jgi:hypothetical protein
MTRRESDAGGALVFLRGEDRGQAAASSGARVVRARWDGHDRTVDERPVSRPGVASHASAFSRGFHTSVTFAAAAAPRLDRRDMTTSGRATSACRDTRAIFGGQTWQFGDQFCHSMAAVVLSDPETVQIGLQIKAPTFSPARRAVLGYWASSGCLSRAERYAFSELLPESRRASAGERVLYHESLRRQWRVHLSRWWPVTCVCDTPITRKCRCPK